MVEWMVSWVWRIGWRVSITLACMRTFQNVISQQGYTILWGTMVAATSCAILLILAWSSLVLSYRDKHGRS